MEWINFENEAPEDGQRCVLFTDDDNYTTGAYDEDEGLFYELEWHDPILNVKAWIPLNECTL